MVKFVKIQTLDLEKVDVNKRKGGHIIMRKNLQKAAGTHFGKPIWLISMIKPPKKKNQHK